MITLEQIKLRNSFSHTGAKRQGFLNLCGNPTAEQEVELINSYAVHVAFLKVAFGANKPLTPCKHSTLLAFRGFLNLEIGLNTEDAVKILSSALTVYKSLGALTSERITRVLNEPQQNCDEQYLSCEPSTHEIEIYNSHFGCNESDKAIVVDLSILKPLLSVPDMTEFCALLAKHLNQKSQRQGKVEAVVICAFMAGLLNQRPGGSLSELHLTAKETRNFVSSTKCASLDSWLRAGQGLEIAWQEWEAAEDVIYAFFEPNGFIALH
ncbi:hypothetical protein [Pseudomonas asiatica]|uniref:hypothetical protein n=1 Tax=Pseudomonas asiatica TaxID=2219225 RepID=UPI003458F0B1